MSDTDNAQEIGLKAKLTLVTIHLVGYLPLGLARAIGAFIGWECWLIKERGTRITLENLDICFPEMSTQEKRKLARQSMVETGRLATEICVIRHRSFDWLQSKLLKTEGEALIKSEIARGKGLILLAPHIGNWEVLSLTLPTYGKLTALYQPPKQLYLEELIKNARQKTGATLVPTDRRGIVKLLSSLKSGGITAVLPDQNPGKGHGEFSPFYGEQAYTMTTVHGFAQRSECAIIFGFVKRVKGGFETYFIEAPKNIYSSELALSLEALNQGVEECISYCPAQYQWEYKRFKKTAPGATRRYRNI